MSRTVKSEENEEPGTVLSIPQETALVALLGGSSQRDAAEEAGIDEATLSRWKHRDPVFVAEFNRRRADLWNARVERLRSLADRAIDTLEELLASDHEPTRLRAVVSVLKSTALLTATAPTGGTTAAEVEAGWRSEAALKKLMDPFSLGGE